MAKRDQVDINATMVMSMGIGMIITDVLSHSFNKGFPIAFPEALAGRKRPAPGRADQPCSQGRSSSLAVGVVAVSAFFLLLYKTRAGRAFRAIAEDPSGARLVGIPLVSTGLQSYALSGLLGGLIAVLLAMLLGSASPGLGEQVAHKVLAVSHHRGAGQPRRRSRRGAGPRHPGGHRAGLHLGIVVERHRLRDHAHRDPRQAEGPVRHEAVGGRRAAAAVLLPGHHRHQHPDELGPLPALQGGPPAFHHGGEHGHLGLPGRFPRQ